MGARLTKRMGPKHHEQRPLTQHSHGHRYSLTAEERERMQGAESLDFTQIDNDILRDFNRRASRWHSMRKSLGKWILCFLIGLMTGMVSYGIAEGVKYLDELKFSTVDIFIKKGWYVVPFFIYLCFNMSFALLGTVIVFIFGKSASGAGVADVKAFLNGIRVPHTVNIKTFFGKVLSLIFAYSSGLALGPEGPMVHIGSMIGGGMGQVQSRAFRFSPKAFLAYRNHRDQRDFLSCGAAAGIAAAFGAPVGGVLYSIEETNSFWTKQLTWRTFFACMISTFTVNLFASGFVNTQTVARASYGLISFGISNDYLYHRFELIPFALIGVIAGLLGALFVDLNVRLNKWRHDELKDVYWKRLLEVAIVVMVTTLCTFWLPAAFGCRSYDDLKPLVSSACGSNATDAPVQMYCKKGYFNDVASLLFNAPHNAVQLLFERKAGVFSMATLAVVAPLYFLLSLVTAGLSVAGGLFIPMMLVGACLGRLVGELMAMMFPDVSPAIDPSIYALIGAAAMMGGFSRMTLSIVVILVELTGDTQYLLPIMLAVMITKWVADAFNDPLYEAQLIARHIPFLETKPPHWRQNQTVQDVMATDVVSFHEVERVRAIYEALLRTSHNGFPIINEAPASTATGPAASSGGGLGSSGGPGAYGAAGSSSPSLAISLEDDYDNPPELRSASADWSERAVVLGSTNAAPEDSGASNGNGAAHVAKTKTPAGVRRRARRMRRLFKGLVLRNQLLIMLHHRLFQSDPTLPLGRDIPYETFTEELNHVVKPIETIVLREEELDMWVDLRPYMSRSAVTIYDTFSFVEAYSMFRTLGLRHITVVNIHNEVVGMVTRKDLVA